MSPPPTILIVEDENILAENLKAFLGRRSPDVRTTPDAEQALEMLNSFTPDVVVMDLVLPGIDGLDAYSEIVRRRRRKIGCVMITGYPMETIAERASARGICHLLYKPFALTELQQLVDKSADEYFSNRPCASMGAAGASNAGLSLAMADDRGAPVRRGDGSSGANGYDGMFWSSWGFSAAPAR